MSSLVFWKKWHTPYRILWLVMGGIFAFSIIIAWFYWIQGPSSVIEWERIQEQETIETVVHSFRLGPFELTVPAESYVIFEYLQGGMIQHNFIASYLYLSVLIVAAIVILTVVTTLEKFWYFFGMSLFILFCVSLRFDVLYLFDFGGIVAPAVIISVFCLVSFYFKSIKPETPFVIRLITFFMLTAVVAGVIAYSSTIVLPFLHLATTAYTPGLILALLFIITVAHEIMVSFLYVAAKGGSNSLRHFLIISLIYFGNLLITCLYIVGYINWNFLYVNPYLLLTVSAILGVWGFRERENLYENIIPFSPFGAYFFAALGSICFITLAHSLGNINDGPLKVMGDVTIFTHTAFAIVFVMYVLSNFIGMMAEDRDVSKVVYKPNRMPYFTFRLAGVIVTLAFLFVSYFGDYISNSFSGFYAYAADLHLMQGNEEYATTFYERSRKGTFQNHRANYQLGMLKANRFDLETADEYFRMANGKNASDFSLVNEANLHLWMHQYFDAIKTFRANQLKSNSAAMANNLGFAYGKIHNLDSALYFFSTAREEEKTKNTAEANFLALSAVELIPVKSDSLIKFFGSNDPGVLANGLASSTLFRQPFSVDVDPLQYKELDLYSATFLNNYIIRNVKRLDSTFTQRALAIASDSINRDYAEALKSSLAYAFYHQGNVTKGYALLAEMAYISQSYQGRYNYVSGLWALEQGSPELAQQYFAYAERNEYKNAALYKAIALTESHSIEQAMIAWDSLKKSTDENEVKMAENIQRILSISLTEALNATDIVKYQYARYRMNVNDTTLFERFVNKFDNADYKARALLDMSKKQWKADRVVPAIKYFQQISGLELTDGELFDEIRHFELRMLAARKEARNLAEAINKGITFDGSRFVEKTLYTAIIAEASGDSTKAEQLYRITASWNPYYEEGVLAAADFYRTRYPNSLKAYDVLAEAIQVNSISLKLLKAYYQESVSRGFEDYAASVGQRIQDIEAGYSR